MSWQRDFADILAKDRPLAPLTYYRIGGTARWFFEPRDAETTARLLGALASDGVPYRVLGGGANVLIEDGVHEIPFIHLGRLDSAAIDGTRVVAAAGVGFPRLVADTVRRGLEGCEGLAGIPGQIGGACAMNAGGRHAELGDVVELVELADHRGEVMGIPGSEVGFSYRATALPPGVVTSVVLRLARADDARAVQRRMGEILREKSRAQPLDVPSSGCIFANPEGTTAGRIIDGLGLKGRRQGAAEVSTVHGNFIVNRGGARFADVMALVRMIEEEVRARSGVRLRREIRVWRRGIEDARS